MPGIWRLEDEFTKVEDDRDAITQLVKRIDWTQVQSITFVKSDGKYILVEIDLVDNQTIVPKEFGRLGMSYGYDGRRA